MSEKTFRFITSSRPTYEHLWFFDTQNSVYVFTVVTDGCHSTSTWHSGRSPKKSLMKIVVISAKWNFPCSAFPHPPIRRHHTEPTAVCFAFQNLQVLLTDVRLQHVPTSIASSRHRSIWHFFFHPTFLFYYVNQRNTKAPEQRARKLESIFGP